MTALTVRLPGDKYRRLKALAQSRGTPLNRLIDEMAALMLAEFDAETRFKLRAARGADRAVRGLELLDKAAGRDGCGIWGGERGCPAHTAVKPCAAIIRPCRSHRPSSPALRTSAGATTSAGCKCSVRPP